jgi:hypothetical protein
MCRVRAIASLQSFGWCWVASPVLLVVCLLASWPAKRHVAAFLEAAGIRLAAMESTDRPEEPLVSSAVLAEWARWADSTRFSTTPRKGWAYDTAEVDAFRQEIRDTFLGVRQPPLTSDEALDRRFRGCPARLRRAQVDAFIDEAEQRLAAMRPTYRGRRD